MENQEPKKAPETTVESDFPPATDRGADIKSDVSSHQNVKVENQEPKKDIKSDASSHQNVKVENQEPKKNFNTTRIRSLSRNR